ncbi:MAG: DUF2071 domain-containing protein [Saprospiraceae bacterium]|nr:DUF2071 domain-containing protein [Saprospiraceae bacterium]
MSFLTAEWKKLAMVNYQVDPSLLTSYLPFGTELDLWKGKCYVSVIGFMFLDTRLLGVKIPFHTNFEEVNLRFYVKRKENDSWKRGVVFIKEIVPKWAIAFIANTVYKENYEALKMDHKWIKDESHLTVEYGWISNKKRSSIRLVADANPTPIEPGSNAEFITEHYWGYAKINDTRTNEYEVTHPRWVQYKVKDAHLNINFQMTYGSKFTFLDNQTPDSLILVEGSKITVEPKNKINS